MSVPAADNLRPLATGDCECGQAYYRRRNATCPNCSATDAADLLDAIDALHQPDPADNHWCFGCDFPHPCATARLLHPEVTE